MVDMIPKKIHYCWFGGNPLPEFALFCLEQKTFRRMIKIIVTIISEVFELTDLIVDAFFQRNNGDVTNETFN